MLGSHESALDALRRAFGWLVTGPHPVGLDGAVIGRAGQHVPLNLLRDELLARRCPPPVRDAVWRELVVRSRRDGPEHAVWTVGAAGVALPALVAVAADCCGRGASVDPDDVDAAVVAGFVGALAVIDLDRPGILTRLRWAAFRAGQQAATAALSAPLPIGSATGPLPAPGCSWLSSTSPPAGDASMVLARAVRAGALRVDQASLIAVTRLDNVPLDEAAHRLGLSYAAVRHRRARAERRLLAYLAGEPATSPAGTEPPEPQSGATESPGASEHALALGEIAPSSGGRDAASRPASSAPRGTTGAGAVAGTPPGLSESDHEQTSEMRRCA